MTELNDARGEVLARVRTALRGTPDPAGSIPRGYRQTGTDLPGSPALLELFTDRLVDYRAAVHRATPDTVGDTVAKVLAELLPAGGRVLVPAGLPDGWAPTGAVRDDGTLTHAELDGMAAVLTGCAAAAAETGTIALDGSAGQGRRAITLIPDRHICVVPAELVVETVPELLGRLDATRPLTFISGPSATSDIELSRVEGVHGPRTLVVVLVVG
jgi:L-lactate dehydrogenase complex protein LldG